MIRFKKQVFIRLVSFTSALVLILVGFLTVEGRAKNYYIMLNKNNCCRDLEELSAALNNISYSVEKAVYSSSAVEFGSLAAELWRESGTAKNALSRLPCGEESLELINRFLSQVGDYSLFLTKKLILGETASADERSKLCLLSKAAGSIASSVDSSLVLYSDGYWTEEIVSSGDAEHVSSFGQSLAELEDTLTDYPTLIYDGPYSEHLLTSVPKMTENAAYADRHSAREAAAEFLSVGSETLENGSDREGTMPCYSFRGADFDIDVTVNGGYIAEYRKYRAITAQSLSYEEAVSIAEEYLSVYGCEFVKTYYFADEGVCTVNFAAVENGCICYPDLVKVGIALDNGELMLVEADGWLFNHREGRKAEPAIAETTASAGLSSLLSVKRSRLAVIPTSGKRERLCYEFLCDGAFGHEVLVYINAETAVEEDILIVLSTDGGTLVK